MTRTFFIREWTCAREPRPYLATMPPANLEAGAYIRGIPRFLAVLANPAALLLLAVLALLALPLSWSPMGTIRPVSNTPGFLVLTALEIAFYFHIAGRAANRDANLSPPPLDRLSAALIGPIWRYVLCLAPVLAGLAWLAAEMDLSLVWTVHFATTQPELLLDHPGPAIVMGLGTLALPLLTLIALGSIPAGSTSAFSASNPLRRIAALRPPTAALAALLFYALTALRWLVVFPAIQRLRGSIEFSLLLPWLAFAAQYAILAVRARALGALLAPPPSPDV